MKKTNKFHAGGPTLYVAQFLRYDELQVTGKKRAI